MLLSATEVFVLPMQGYDGTVIADTEDEQEGGDFNKAYDEEVSRHAHEHWGVVIHTE